MYELRSDDNNIYDGVRSTGVLGYTEYGLME